MVLCFLAYSFLSLIETAENSFVVFSKPEWEPCVWPRLATSILQKSELMLETAWLPQAPHCGAAKPP